MRRIVVLVIAFFLLPFLLKAQFNHFISYNTYVYGNFFNKEIDKIDMPQAIRIPIGSYKVKKNRWGVEFFFNYQNQFYHSLNRYATPDDLLYIRSANLGLAAHYDLLQHKRVSINPLMGVIKNWYDATVLDWVNGFGELFIHSEKESKWGLLGGVNIKVPIYKNIYTNANLRYSVFPTAEFNKRNLITEFGVGYRLFQKKKDL